MKHKMDHLSPEKLIELNKQGIIPGPKETEEDYWQRAKYCMHIRETLAAHVGDGFPLKGDGKGPRSIFDASHKATRPLYGIEPDWIPLFFSNYRLAPWHGGCAWIFQLEEEAPVSALFQLRKKFENPEQNSFYSREEIIAHEMAHVGRMMYDEPQFEELLAYRSSPSPFRRRFGPIVKNSIESGLFVLVLILIAMLDLFFVFSGYEAAYHRAMWLKLVPLAMIGYSLFRLSKKQKQFKRCLESLEGVLKDEEKASQAAYRLTDAEIIAFGGSAPEQIIEYANKNQEASLRWKVIAAAYFIPCQ